MAYEPQTTPNFYSIGLTKTTSDTLTEVWNTCGWRDSYNVGSANIGQLLMALAVSADTSSDSTPSAEDAEKKKDFYEAMKIFKSNDIVQFIDFAVETFYPPAAAEDENLTSLTWKFTTGNVRINRTPSRVFSTRLIDAAKSSVGLIFNTFRQRLDHTANSSNPPEDFKDIFDAHREKCSIVLDELTKLLEVYKGTVLSKLPEKPRTAHTSTSARQTHGSTRQSTSSGGVRYVKWNNDTELKIPPGYIALVPVDKLNRKPHTQRPTQGKYNNTSDKSFTKDSKSTASTQENVTVDNVATD